jgi:hypothetical protein
MTVFSGTCFEKERENLLKYVKFELFESSKKV